MGGALFLYWLFCWNTAVLFVAFQDQLTMERGFTSAIYINWAVILYRQNGKKQLRTHLLSLQAARRVAIE